MASHWRKEDLFILLITEVFFLGRIKGQVANSGNQGVNAKGEVGQEEVSQRSGGVTLGLEVSMVDNDTADPTQKESQQKADQVIVVIVFHDANPFSDVKNKRFRQAIALRAPKNAKIRPPLTLLYSIFEYLSTLKL